MQANKWCASGMDMLTSQQMDGCTTPDAIHKAVQDIDEFVITARELKLNNPKEFRQLFESMINSDMRVGRVRYGINNLCDIYFKSKPNPIL